jgi:hypothetical protein
MIRAGHCVVARVRRDERQLVLFGEIEARPTLGGRGSVGHQTRIRTVRVFTDDQST